MPSIHCNKYFLMKVRLDRQVHKVLAATVVHLDHLDSLEQLVYLETQVQMLHPHHHPKEVIQVHLARLVSQDKVVLLVNLAQGVLRDLLELKEIRGSKVLLEILVPKDRQDLPGPKDLVVLSEAWVLLDYGEIQASEETQEQQDHQVCLFNAITSVNRYVLSFLLLLVLSIAILETMDFHFVRF